MKKPIYYQGFYVEKLDFGMFDGDVGLCYISGKQNHV